MVAPFSSLCHTRPVSFITCCKFPPFDPPPFPLKPACLPPAFLVLLSQPLSFSFPARARSSLRHPFRIPRKVSLAPSLDLVLAFLALHYIRLLPLRSFPPSLALPASVGYAIIFLLFLAHFLRFCLLSLPSSVIPLP